MTSKLNIGDKDHSARKDNHAIGNPFANSFGSLQCKQVQRTSLCTTLRITPGTSSAKTTADGALTKRHEGLRAADRWIAS
jgi:hypothetical protein